jgi:hypothetical protein
LNGDVGGVIAGRKQGSIGIGSIMTKNVKGMPAGGSSFRLNVCLGGGIVLPMG